MWVGMKIVRLRTSSFFKRFLFSPSSEYWSNRRNAEWLDVSIVKRKGKAFETSSSLISARDAFLFPPTFCYNLNGTGVEIPASIVGMKLLVFSFKQYGFQLGKTYLTHFNDRFSCTQGVCSFELCFVEHKFLSFTKGLLISGLKSSTNANRYDKTAFAFGGTKVCPINHSIYLSHDNCRNLLKLYKSQIC